LSRPPSNLPPTHHAFAYNFQSLICTFVVRPLFCFPPSPTVFITRPRLMEIHRGRGSISPNCAPHFLIANVSPLRRQATPTDASAKPVNEAPVVELRRFLRSNPTHLDARGHSRTALVWRLHLSSQLRARLQRKENDSSPRRACPPSWLALRINEFRGSLGDGCRQSEHFTSSGLSIGCAVRMNGPALVTFSERHFPKSQPAATPLYVPRIPLLSIRHSRVRVVFAPMQARIWIQQMKISSSLLVILSGATWRGARPQAREKCKAFPLRAAPSTLMHVLTWESPCS